MTKKHNNIKEPELDYHISGSYVISLEGCRFYAFHGVMEQERKTGNEFELSLEASMDDGDTICSSPDITTGNRETDTVTDFADDVSHTVSYADLYEICREEMEKPRNLLETVVKRIALRALERFERIDAIKISLRKTTPPIPGITGSAQVTFKAVRNRDLPF